jgi:hypothetical protein
MTTITFEEDIKISTNKFRNFSSFIEDFARNNFPDSNIDDEYEVASKMKNSGLPDTFIKNYVKSYE